MVSPPGASVPYCQMGSGDKPPGRSDRTRLDPDRRRSAIGKEPCGDLIVVGYFRYRYREAYISLGPLHLGASSGLAILPGGKVPVGTRNHAPPRGGRVPVQPSTATKPARIT